MFVSNQSAAFFYFLLVINDRKAKIRLQVHSYLGCKINVSWIVLVGTRYYLVGSQVLVVQVPRGGRGGGSCRVLRTQVIGIIVLSSTMVLGTMILVRVVVLSQIF